MRIHHNQGYLVLLAYQRDLWTPKPQSVRGAHITMSDDCPDRDLLCINVGGREFWTYYSTLERLPGTTLSRIAREKHSHETWMESRKCYFFDRSPDAFRSVLEYYRCVELLLCVLYFIQSVNIICISPSSKFHNLHFKNSSDLACSDSVVKTQNNFQ